MYFTDKLQFLISELNKNKLKISRGFFTIFLSLLIFSSVTIFKNSIENQIKSNSRVFLGGDFELSTKYEPLKKDILDQLKDSFFLSEVIDFTSILRANNEESKTIRIKVIDNFYPLVGNVNVQPSDSFKILQIKPNSILVDETIKNNLNLKIGDKIKLQNTSLEVIGIIKGLPDIDGFFSFLGIKL